MTVSIRGLAVGLGIPLLAACGGEQGGRASGSDTEGLGSFDDSSSAPADDSSSTSSDEPPADGSTTTGEHFDCSPWASTWIGAPCASDAECTYEGGLCLREDEGFPCGTCSQPCDGLCPDLEGTPETFCVDGSDVDIEPTGFCLSKCSPELLGANGCRDGYDCAALSRYMDASVTTGVCVPEGLWSPMTACQQDLVDRGVAFVPTTHELDHPEGHPELDCVIIDPVLLYGPIGGVGLSEGGDMHPVLIACEGAQAIVDTAEIAAAMAPVGATEIQHYGTYNCRVIAGTSTLSNHAEGRAIDLAAFVLADGRTISVFEHWEDGVVDPVTEEGQWLRDFADTLWETMTWNIILTPEYNADHDNHFHVDLTPGEMFYQ